MRTTALTFALVAGLIAPAASHARRCPADSVQVGDVCVDKYEASVWSTTDARTIGKIQRGKITSALDLALATQHGAGDEDDYGPGCPATGAGCVDYYAVSAAGITPSAWLTQFQAMAACRNAGKHLATNLEWQAAALGTPDPGMTDNGMTDCNVGSTFAVASTGSRASCLSDAGALDMVGNLYEWVADWAPKSTACPGWGGLTDDRMCFAGASTDSPPGVLIRGGFFFSGSFAGPFAVDGITEPFFQGEDVGFRCARRL